MTTTTLSDAVRGGTRWALAAQLAAQLLGLAVLAALFRLVERADFGLLGMALPVVLLLRATLTLGLAAAAVQRRELTSAQMTSLFWYHQGAGLAAALATAAAGPLLARWYSTPDLASVCAALAGLPPAAALGSQHLALLERHLQMGRMAVSRLVAQALGGGLAVAAAFAGWGVWALIVQQYAELLLLAALAMGFEAWRPDWPWRGERVPGLVRFGGYFNLNTLLTMLAQCTDTILLSVMIGGNEAGRAMLGMYAQAANLMIKPVYVVTTPVSAVALAALSRARGDRPSYEAHVTAFLRLVGIVLFPTGIGLFLAARDLMLVLGGEKWREAGILLEALAPAIAAHGLILLCTFVFVSADRGGHLVAASLVKTLLFVQGSAAGYYLGAVYAPAPLGSAWGVASGHSLVAVVVLGIPYVVYCLRTVGVAPGPVLWGLARPLLYALVMGAVVWSLRRVLTGFPFIPPEARLAALVLTGVCVYGLLSRSEIAWLGKQFLWPK